MCIRDSLSAVHHSGNVCHRVWSDDEFVNRDLRVLYPAVCRVRRKVEVQRADRQPFGGFFRDDDVSRPCVDHEIERDTVSAALDVVVAACIRFDPNDVVRTFARTRFVTGLQNRGKEGNEAEQSTGQRWSIGCPAERCRAEAQTGHSRDARPKRCPSLFLCFPYQHIRGHGVLLGPSA